LQAIVSTLPNSHSDALMPQAKNQAPAWRSIVIAAIVSTFPEIEISQRQFQKPQKPPHLS
jgi:hypothetical protein